VGFAANIGFSNVNDRVLISMSNMSSTIISPDRILAYIGLGARWGSAIAALNPYNVTVVRGRIGKAGFVVILICYLLEPSSKEG
jgi:hypothetical protein